MSKLIGVPLPPTNRMSPVSVLEQLNLLYYVSRQGFTRQMISFTKVAISFCRLKEYWLKSCQIFFYTTLDILLFAVNILPSV